MEDLSPALLRDMASKGIDASLSLSILDDWNSGLYDSVAPVKAAGVPKVDGARVIAISPTMPPYAAPEARVRERLASLGLGAYLSKLPRGVERTRADGEPGLAFTRQALEGLGTLLLPRCAWGVLNGGSATSYADSKKNLAFGSEVFSALEGSFDLLAPLCKDRPKGITPAWINSDGSPGESFLLLKMRSRLLAAERCRAAGAWQPGSGPFMPLFQMTSVANDAELAQAYESLKAHPMLAPLSRRLGLEGTEWATGIQSMISAYTHSSEGRPRRIFDRAYGQKDSALPLPGGHGQCFRVLAGVLRALRDGGCRFAYLGNVDNLGYMPDPVELALLALSGMPAAFDFAFRTPVDVKGGILVETAGGSRTVADIGPAISFDEVARLESAGASILFNCATGLFDLDWLVPRIEDIGRRLPVRFTDQDKDAGRYSQAEQVTWEVSSLLPDFLAFAVDKYERFIAAKLLVETLLTSGVGHGDPRIPEDLARISRLLHAGLERKLGGLYGLVLDGGRWRAGEPG